LRLEIPGEVVRAETDKVAGELARQVNVPGFRRGHVPKSVVKTRFKKELRDEVLSHLIPDSLGDAIKQKSLKVVGQPSVEEMKFTDDDGIDLTITIEVAPEFELSNYKSLPLRKRVYKIREQDIDQAVDRLRSAHSQLVPVEDRGAQIRDVVTAKVTRHFQEEAESEGEANREEESQEIDVELGAKGVLTEFTNAFSGARTGETKEFTVTYPDDYRPEEFAGRTVQYTAEIMSVRAKELPDADDDFAALVNEEFQTIAELRSNVRERLEHETSHRTDEELKTAVIDQLLERNRFEVPESAVEQAIDARMRTFFRNLSAQGMDPRSLQLDWQRMRDAHRDKAAREVRTAFILDRIADAERIEVPDEELEQQLRALADASEQPFEALKARLTKEGALDRLREQVRNRKALDLVLESADIRIEEVEGVGSEDHPE